MERGEANREKISELVAYLTCGAWVAESDVTEVSNPFPPPPWLFMFLFLSDIAGFFFGIC